MEANTGFYPLFLTGIPLSGYDLHRAVLNWEVDKVVAILEERFVTELTSCTVDSDVGAKEYETIYRGLNGEHDDISENAYRIIPTCPVCQMKAHFPS